MEGPLTLINKPSKKHDRQFRVLKGLVELYLRTGKAIGSLTLQENGFPDLSSATIRNYFANLEQAGYLMQQHSSGGRIPTDVGLKWCIDHWMQEKLPLETPLDDLMGLFAKEQKEVALLLQSTAEVLSQKTNTAVFLTAPRFDHDAIVQIKLVPLNINRCLSVILTQFGVVQTEVLQVSQENVSWSFVEHYCMARLAQQPLEICKDSLEVQFAESIYCEIMMRYVGQYTHFTQSDVWRTGLSRLLVWDELSDPGHLIQVMGLFENQNNLRSLLQAIEKRPDLSIWMSDDLTPYMPGTRECAVAGIPYFINQLPVGAIGCLAAKRMDYLTIIPLLRWFAEKLSEALTQNVYHFKIQCRQASQATPQLTNPFPLLQHQNEK